MDHGDAIGLFDSRTHDVVDVPACGVVRPVLAQVAGALRQAMKDAAAAQG